MKYTTLAILSVVLLSIGVFSVASANHAWGKYHWDLSTEETQLNPLKIGDNLSTIWDSYLVEASLDWNESVLKNAVVPGTTTPNCDPTFGQVEVCSDLYGSTGWLGIAQVWAYRGKDAHIAQAVVKLNDTYFNQSPYNSDSWRQMVVCQEVGHTFGLDHQDENFSNNNLGTCMDYTDDPAGTIRNSGIDNEHPNDHDYEMLTEIYAHLNSPTNGGGNGKPDKGNGGGNGNGKGKPAYILGNNIDLNNPSAWGEAIRQDAQGKNSLYVRKLGNGLELVTHVTWIPENL